MSVTDDASSGLPSAVMCIKVRDQIDHRIRDNRRIICDETAFEAAQEWLSGQPEIFYSDGIRKLINDGQNALNKEVCNCSTKIIIILSLISY
jgi:hypothetical protein